VDVSLYLIVILFVLPPLEVLAVEGVRQLRVEALEEEYLLLANCGRTSSNETRIDCVRILSSFEDL
jgi:hypothetical protein